LHKVTDTRPAAPAFTGTGEVDLPGQDTRCIINEELTMTEDRQTYNGGDAGDNGEQPRCCSPAALPYPRLWTALVSITLGTLAKSALEELRDHPVTPHPRSLDAGMMAQLVRDGLAVGEPSGRKLGGRLEWTDHITPAGRAWLENCRDVPDPR
jgi:hypothetical protein